MATSSTSSRPSSKGSSVKEAATTGPVKSSSLPVLPNISRLSPRVIRILGQNPSKFTLQGTNTYLVGTGRQRILVDSAQGLPAYKELLSQTLKEENCSVKTVILTHWHVDHVSGVPDVLNLCPSAEIYKFDGDDARYEYTARDGSTAFSTQKDIDNGMVFKVDGATLKAIHTPGHAYDHVCLFLEEEDSLFSGDNVLGHGTCVFEDLKEYLDTLDLMNASYGGGTMYPAHGQMIESGKARIDEYKLHRKRREDEIVAQMTVPRTSAEIAVKVYGELPEEVRNAAEGGVIQVLNKLMDEGRVKEDENRRYSLVEKEKEREKL